MPSYTLPRTSSSNLDKMDSKGNDVGLDRKTRQIIFYQGSVCAVSRNQLKSLDASDQKAVGRLFGSQLNKRQAHGAQVTCLEDRLNFKKVKIFGKSPFRNWVLYSDIEHYFVFPDHPNLFMLAVKSDNPENTYFETYKCKTKAEAELLCELICRACRDPEKKLRKEPGEGRPYATLSEVSIHSNAISHPNLSMVGMDSCGLNETNDVVCSNEALAKESEEPTVNGSPILTIVGSLHASPNGQLSPVVFPDIEDEVLAQLTQDVDLTEIVETPVEATFARRDSETSEEKEKDGSSIDKYLNGSAQIENDYEDEQSGMTYFDYNPKMGAVLNNEGPIYMYLKRYECSTGQECLG